jgi:DNA-directed RNA polymerase specialized sigma24 family protein
MFGAKRITKQEPTPYATRSDFCRIFEKDMNRLYLLCLFLTAEHSSAEKSFIRGLEDSAKSNRVFREWAQSWARRTIIQNAIRMTRPRPTEGNKSSSRSGVITGVPIKVPTEIAQIIQLPAFERFVFVMSVLEGYSNQECSLLLDCTRGEVNATRTRVLEQIGRSAQLQRRLVPIGPGQKPLEDDPGSELPLEVLSRELASA